MTLSPFLLAFVVNHLTEAPPVVRRILSSAPLRFMGICSYSIYLWQQPFYQYRETLPDMPIEQVLLLLFMALGMGIFMFYRIENPIRAYLNRVW